MDVHKSKDETSSSIPLIRPTQFSTSEKTQFLELDESRLSVRYIGKGQHQHDVGISSFNHTTDLSIQFFLLFASQRLKTSICVLKHELLSTRFSLTFGLVCALVWWKLFLSLLITRDQS